ncbi:MAG: helix-turn-helix transcriptional regulator [Coleofasciculaceae cyanobacterium SM2_1_6]|nr:helix-turn-helix transcriptional regulator [Coleofasciculaceae cyanobacterium SM2_1_6]
MEENQNSELENISAMKKRREELGLSQRELAIKAGITTQTISNIENGRYKKIKLEPHQFKKLCKALEWQTIDDVPDNWLPPVMG